MGYWFFCRRRKKSKPSIFLSKDDSYLEITSPFKNNLGWKISAKFFDSDNDGDLDLYVASGGKAFSIYNRLLDDRLYINDGNENFSLSKDSFDFEKPISTGAIAIEDIDNDGLLDVFIGERYNTNLYGLPVSGYLFKNKGNNKFERVEQNSLQKIGLIKSAQWVNLNNDEFPDLIIAGEWMPIKIFINNKKFKRYDKRIWTIKFNRMWM